MQDNINLIFEKVPQCISARVFIWHLYSW